MNKHAIFSGIEPLPHDPSTSARVTQEATCTSRLLRRADAAPTERYYAVNATRSG